MTSISREQKDKAVQIALDGGDPKPFLKECGSKAPDKLWYYIKNVLKKKDPETYEKLAKTARVRKQVETPEGEFAQVKVDGPIRIQTETPEKITFVDGGLLPKVTGIEYKVTGISTSAGDFQYFRRQGYLDWTTLNGETVSMNLEEWKEFMKLFPEVLNVLGVEL